MIRFLDHVSDLDRVWEIEFGTSTASSGAGLTMVDHIGQTMRYEEMLSWTLFYTSIFDAEKAPMVDVVDPDGLVRSQAVRSGRLRVTLNGAETRRTLAGRFIEESFGSSVQHLALATDDIFATAAAFAERGFQALRIGANYYDDIEARFGLDAALVARMKAANILYDRDETGEFFQLYSETQQNSFFFEIVQRVRGYEGYGAPNAPFRIAAQRRGARPTSIPAR